MRIVSLLPSTTEIICKLGFEDCLVGRSHECDQPESIVELPVLTTSSVKNNGNSSEIDKSVQAIIKNGLSVFQVKTELLSEINPDIIFTQDHCEVCAVPLHTVKEAVHQVCDNNTEIISVSPENLSDIYDSIRQIGSSLNSDKKADILINEIECRMDIIRSTVIGEPVKKTACIEWIDPLMMAGNWIPELLEIAGGEYILSTPGKHSAWVEWDEIVEEDPEFILIMPCGYEIEQTTREIHHLIENNKWDSLRAVENNNVFILDGNRYFNRPGPTIFESARILAEVLHPKLFKPVHNNNGWIRYDEELQNN